MKHEKRACKRFIVKLPVEVQAGNHSVEGITVRISEKGVFVRARENFASGVPVELSLDLGDAGRCRMKGVVRHARTIDFLRRQNGMGIEFTEKDPRYLTFMESVKREKD